MRINNLKIAALMAATVLAGCRTAGDIDEIVAPHGFEFSATTEQDSKTALDGTKILWMAGDEISIFQGSAKGSKFVLAKGENTPNGTFSIAAGETFDFFGSTDPDATDPDYIALYPYDAAATIDGETVIATLPATQTYAENSFGNGAYPMIARSASRALAFKNVCGGIELPLKDDNGKIVVKSVKISGNNGEKIAGEARIETGDVPTVIVAETGSESVTLDYGEGVALDAAAKSFILALPPTEFANGITIEVATANGVFTKTTANAVSIVRSGIRKMAELQVEEQTEEAGPVICNGESYETIADAVAANTDATEITLKAGTFTLPNDLKNLTINGREGTEINIENANPSRYSDVVFNNITFNVGQNSYHGFQHAGNITFNKCTINGLLFGYGSHEIYNECVFNNPTGEYCMWTYGANADYTGCVFKGNGKFLHVYNEGSADLRTINIKNCKFVSTAKNKAAVNVKSSCGDTHLKFNVNIDNCTTEGKFPEANGGLWACDNVFFDTVSIKVDGTEVYLDYKEVDGGYEIYSAKGLQWLAEQVNGGNNFSGKTITLTADIDLDGIDWKPIGNVTSYPGITFAGTFDGGEHTISNLTTSDNTTAHASAGLFGSITGKVRNLKLENVTVSSSHYAGAIVGYSSEGVGMEISNCHVNGGTIVSSPEAVNGGHDNGDKVGGIIGYTVAGNVVKGCSVSNITVSGYRDIGGIAGGSAANVSNCTATAVTIVQDNTNAYKNERITTYKSIIGRDLGGTKTGNTASNMTYCIKNLTTTDALSFTNASVAESGSTFILDGVSVQSVTINGAAKIDTFTVKNSAITAAETNPGGPARFGFFIAPNTTDVLTVNVENTIFNSSWSHAIYAQILGNENFNIKVSGCNFSNWGMKETAETDKATSACLKILNAPGITETETERTNYTNTFLSANTWTKPEATYTVINLTDKDNVEHCFSE